MRLKFGELDSKTIARIQSTDADQLLVWSERIFNAKTAEDIFHG